MGGRGGIAAAATFGVALVVGAVATVTPGSARVGLAALAVAGVAHLLVLRAQGPAVRIACGFAALAALVWLAHPPPLSDDIHRYLLDGLTSQQGVNPFAYAPASAKVAEWAAQVPPTNHAHLPTIYPPVAQGLFAAAGVAGPSVLAWRVLCIVGVLLAVWLLRRDARTAGLGWWCATHPLVVVTAAGNGNVDVFALPLMAGFLLAGRAGWRGVAVGLAAGVKLFPLALAGAVAGRGGLGASLRVGVVAGGVLAAAYAPLSGLGPKALGSLGTYSESWAYQAGPQALVERALDTGLARAGVEESLRDPLGGDDAYYGGVHSARRWTTRRALAFRLSRWVGLLAVAIAGLVAWRRRAPPAQSAVWILGAFLLTSPVVHPWYLLWMLVPAAMAGSGWALCWCALASLGFVGPAVAADTGVWVDPVWSRWVVYGGPALVAAVWRASPRAEG